MIQDQRHILINAPIEKVFSIIETMPNKFPVYRVLETKPFVFLRLLLVDGYRSAIKISKTKKPIDKIVLNTGDSFGPFTLTEVESPYKYLFTLKSFFFDCQTGYTLSANKTQTRLNFDLIADNPSNIEKLYWIFVKPIHGLLAQKVLKEIREKAEC